MCIQPMRGQLLWCTRTNVCPRVYGDVVLHKAAPWHACDHYIMPIPAPHTHHVTSCQHLRSAAVLIWWGLSRWDDFPLASCCVCLNPSAVWWRKWRPSVADTSKRSYAFPCFNVCLGMSAFIFVLLWFVFYVTCLTSSLPSPLYPAPCQSRFELFALTSP